MPETPIRTETGVHPFDAVELGVIRNICNLRMDDGEHLLTLEYAETVMPAMADKIKQLRAAMQAAEAKVRAIGLIQVWACEDGRQFMLADDVRAALGIPS
jgi:hypothetical protein